MRTRTLQGQAQQVSRPRSAREIDARVRRALLQLKRALREVYGERFKGLYLYGSRARGDDRADSDVDTIITKKLASEMHQ